MCSSQNVKTSTFNVTISFQAEMAPEATPRAGSQKGWWSRSLPLCLRFTRRLSLTDFSPCHCSGASEISDACKPLKKRSRASTDVEMASSQYRDTSDSDSRGLNDPQVGLEKIGRLTHKSWRSSCFMNEVQWCLEIRVLKNMTILTGVCSNCTASYLSQS